MNEETRGRTPGEIEKQAEGAAHLLQLQKENRELQSDRDKWKACAIKHGRQLNHLKTQVLHLAEDARKVGS